MHNELKVMNYNAKQRDATNKEYIPCRTKKFTNTITNNGVKHMLISCNTSILNIFLFEPGMLKTVSPQVTSYFNVFLKLIQCCFSPSDAAHVFYLTPCHKSTIIMKYINIFILLC